MVLVLNVWCLDGRYGGAMMGLMGKSCFMLWVNLHNMLAFLVIVIKTIQMELLLPNYF